MASIDVNNSQEAINNIRMMEGVSDGNNYCT